MYMLGILSRTVYIPDIIMNNDKDIRKFFTVILNSEVDFPTGPQFTT